MPVWVSSLLAQPVLSGPQLVCVGQCMVYTWAQESGTITPTWSVLFEDGSPVSFTILEGGTQIEVCFLTQGTYTISAGTNGPFLTVNAGTTVELSPEVLSPSACAESNGDCYEFCVGSRVIWQFPGEEPEFVQWSFSGDGIVIEENNLGIIIEFGDVPGTSFVSFFGSIGDRQCFFEGSFCVQTIESPIAGFTTFPEAINDTIRICRNQNIVFQNTSNATNVQWFSDFNQSGSGVFFNPSFAEEGIYEVVQQVASGCECLDTKKVIVEVLPGEGAIIYCLSSVCLGDTTVYSSDPSCEPYDWQIEGAGSIVSGGGPNDDFVEVVWIGGTEGVVQLSNGCSSNCPIPTRERINILGGPLSINGPVNICLNQTYAFFTPLYNGATYSWGISPGGFFVSNPGSNQVTAQFFNFSSEPFVYVTIEDCTRGCISVDTLLLQPALPYEIQGPGQSCLGEEATWQASSSGTPVLSTWKVIDSDGNTVFIDNTPSETLTWAAINPGVYTISGSPATGNYCTEEAFQSISVNRQLPGILEVTGAVAICPGVFYSYSVVSDDAAGVIFEWDIRRGAETERLYGSTVLVAWDNIADQSIRVSIIDALSGCVIQGEWISIERIDEISLLIEEEVCPFSETVITLEGEQLSNISWSVSPNQAGLIVDYPSSSSVRIKWHGPGLVEVSAMYCGLSVTRTVTIKPNLSPSVTFPASLCAGDTGLFTADTGYDAYEWFRDGFLVCSGSNECVGGAGPYLLVVKDAEGCEGRFRFKVEEQSHPNLVIRPGGPTGLCIGESVQLFSNILPVPGFEYNWYLNGTQIATGAGPLLATDFGEYFLEAIHTLTGCSYISNIIVVCDFCPGDGSVLFICPGTSGGIGGGGTCDPSLGGIQAVFSPLSGCNEFMFSVNNPSVISASVTWLFYDGPDLTQLTGSPVSFSFRSRGNQVVFVFADIVDVSGDTLSLCREVLLPETFVGVDFTESVECTFDPVLFLAEVDLDTGVTVTGFEWDFGDPATGPDNTSILQDPSHIFSAPGIYTVTLRLFTSATCFVEIEKDVSIPELPDPTFFMPDSVCTNQSIFATPQEDYPFLSWYFDNSNLPDKVHDVYNPGVFRYEVAGTYEVRLQVEDLKGCQNESVQEITILDFSGVPVITADKAFPLCEGDTAVLSTLSGNYSYLWNDGSSEDSLIITTGGFYGVTLTDENGCTAAAGPFEAVYLPLPEAGIFGQIPGGVAFFQGDTLSACFGTPIWIQALGTRVNRSYEWSDGSTVASLKYDDTERPLLEPGLYSFTFEVTNILSGCAAQSDSFFVRIHPVPAEVVLITDLSPPLCSNETVQISVQNPNSELTYTWSNGNVGAELSTQLAGIYTVTATNTFSCSSESNSITIHPLPDVNFAPKGCLAACEQLELCYPLPEGYTLVDWKLDGESISIPPDPRQIIVSESGAYSGIIEDDRGCRAETNPISIDIFEETSDLSGFVFLDVDRDGVFMPPDSLLGGVWIYLWSDGILLDSIQTDMGGTYLFTELSGGDYLIIIDGSNLPTDWIVQTDTIALSIIPCTADLEVEPFIYQRCEEDAQEIDVDICFGTSIEIEGVLYDRDTTFTITSIVGSCITTTTYQVTVQPEPGIGEEVIQGCLGNIVDRNGELFTADTIFFEMVLTPLGCDSTTRVVILFEDQITREEQVQLCPRDTLVLYGLEITEAQQIEVFLQGQGMDCDTLVFLEVIQLPIWEVSAFTEPSCPELDNGSIELELTGITLGELPSVTINGVSRIPALEYTNLAPGSLNIIFQDERGCQEALALLIETIEPINGVIIGDTISCETPEGLIRVAILTEQTGSLSFLWPNGTSGDTLIVSEPGMYSVRVSNACEEVTITGSVVPAPGGERARFYVPNAFTPNNDEINDVFKPYFQEGLTFLSYQFEVFDRWGNKVFETDDPDSGWDGIYLNTLADQAVFVWKFYALVTHCAETKILKDYGDVLLLKL